MPQRKKTTVKTKKVNVPRQLSQKVVHVKRTFQASTIASNASVYTSTGSIAFALSQCPAPTDFTNLFDQYRIVKTQINFVPNYSGNTAGGIPGLYNIFYMAVDHTDVTSPTQASDVLQYDAHRLVQPYKPFSITFKPAPSSSFFNSTTTTGYGPRQGAWLDSSSPAVPHYGLKWVWDCNSATATNILPYVSLWLEFREAR